VKQASQTHRSESNRDTTTVLMYHAVDDPTAPAADPHYSVSPATFAEQVSMIAQSGQSGASVLNLLAGHADACRVAVTFDDGHASNREAAEVLAAAGMSADFFVNPSTIGAAGFLSWADLRQMLALGMSVQSHGMHHRYLSDLSAPEVRQELVDSKTMIEQQLGTAVTIFAPPGGRMPPQFAQTAAQAGYEAVCSSAVAYWQPARRAEGVPGAAQMIPRLAVLNATKPARFKRWISGDRPEMWKLQLRGVSLHGAKWAVGKERDDKLRQAIVGGPSS